MHFNICFVLIHFLVLLFVRFFGIFPQQYRLIYRETFRQLVCDKQNSNFAFKLINRLCKHFCGLLVEIAGCFIKDEDIGLA